MILFLHPLFLPYPILSYHTSFPTLSPSLISGFLNTSVFTYTNICIFKFLHIRTYSFRYTQIPAYRNSYILRYRSACISPHASVFIYFQISEYAAPSISIIHLISNAFNIVFSSIWIWKYANMPKYVGIFLLVCRKTSIFVPQTST